jgi:NAD(P)-dependent dehydrogenase (short-subunit alcohol dehydrogenase family)
VSAPRVALVTGAGGGLGAATSRALRAAGFHVVVTDRDLDLLSDFTGVDGYTALALDVTDSVAAAEVAQHVRSTLGRLDVLVNNAGIIGYFPTVEMDPEVLVRHFQVNTFGALRTVHACLDLLVAARGRVVNVTSESYRFRNPFQIYQTTKLALEGLSDVMRRELAPLGVSVSTVRPGAIRTELFHAMGSIENPVPDSRLAAPFARFARMLAHKPPKRVSRPEDVAAVLVRAATEPRPRPHYAINNMLALRVAALLPTSVADRAVGRMTSVNGRARARTRRAARGSDTRPSA